MGVSFTKKIKSREKTALRVRVMWDGVRAGNRTSASDSLRVRWQLGVQEAVGYRDVFGVQRSDLGKRSVFESCALWVIFRDLHWVRCFCLEN